MKLSFVCVFGFLQNNQIVTSDRVYPLSYRTGKRTTNAHYFLLHRVNDDMWEIANNLIQGDLVDSK